MSRPVEDGDAVTQRFQRAVLQRIRREEHGLPRGDDIVVFRSGELVRQLLAGISGAATGLEGQAATVVASPAPLAAVAPAATVQPPARPTLPPTTSVALAPVTVLSERFASNQQNWPNDASGTSWLHDGIYRLSVKQPGQFVGIRAPMTEALRDGIVTGVFRKIGGPAGGGYGMILRDQGTVDGAPMSQRGRFYVFEVGDRGDVGVWRRDGDQWVELLPWTASEAVKPGQEKNELSVTAIGPEFAFKVNGTTVASLEDPTLIQGAVGIFAGGDLNDVVVEQVTVAALR
jgi:hypothetical protein